MHIQPMLCKKLAIRYKYEVIFTMIICGVRWQLLLQFGHVPKTTAGCANGGSLPGDVRDHRHYYPAGQAD